VIEKVQPKNIEVPGKKSQQPKSLTSINDYLDLRIESNLKKILEKNNEDLARTTIFSDYVTRINSNSERKLRIIVITSMKGVT
jgi:hypothetical protein